MKKLILIASLCLASITSQHPLQAKIGLRGCTTFISTATLSRFQEGSMWELRCNIEETTLSAYEWRGDTWVYIGGGFFPSAFSVVYVPWTPLPMRVFLRHNGCNKEIRF